MSLPSPLNALCNFATILPPPPGWCGSVRRPPAAVGLRFLGVR